MKTRLGLIILLASMLLLVGILPAAGAQRGAPERPTAPPVSQPSAAPQPTTPTRSAGAPESTLTGWFTIIWGDHEPGSHQEGPIIYSLFTDGNTRYELRLDERSAVSPGQLLALNGQRVEVRGAVGEGTAATSAAADMAVADDPELFITTMTAAEPDGPQVNEPAGSRWVTVACKLSDIPDEPEDLPYLQSLYSDDRPGLDHFWREMSYDAISVLDSQAFGWYTLPSPRSRYVTSTDSDLIALFEDCTAAADADIDFTEFEGINLFFNESIGCCAFGGGVYVTLDGETRVWRATWEPPYGFQNIGVLYHEMGHAYGMPHSSGNYGAVYDNPWDMMSDLYYNCDNFTDPTFGCVGQGTIAYNRLLTGWIPPEREYVAGPGYHEVTLERLDLPTTDNYLVAKIPINESANRYYTLEARQQVGYDEKLPGVALIIHEVNSYRSEPAHVIDRDNDGNNADGGTMWIVYDKFIDPTGDISVWVEAEVTNGWFVHIQNNSLALVDPYEPNNTPQTAAPIAYEDELETALIDGIGDEDYYVFQGNSGQAIEAYIEATGDGSALNSQLYLYDSNMELLTWNDDADSADSHLEYTLPNDGEYYLLVKEQNHGDEGGEDYFYTLTLSQMGSWQEAWIPPIADAYVDESKKTTNYGSAPFLRVKNAGKDMNAYIKYDVDVFNPEPGACYEIGDTWLGNRITEPGVDGGNIYMVSNGWDENTITWKNAPPITGDPLGNFGPAIYLDAWTNLGSLIEGNGLYSFAIRNNSGDSVDYSSREGEQNPWLFIYYREDQDTRLRADFSASSYDGTPPHAVAFTDHSRGCPTSWKWNFGDGATSTDPNPSHTYTSPGRYSVNLTVTTSEGSASRSKTITVGDTPRTTYLSLSKKANVGGLTVEPADIVRYRRSSNTWTMIYDGSAHGTNANVSSFAWDDNDLLLVFAGKQVIPGLGTATQHDVVRFTPDTPWVFPLGSGAFSWAWRGADHGLTTGKEKIDALDLSRTDGHYLFSTSGAAALPNGLKPADEDLALWHSSSSTWDDWLWLDGSTVPGLAAKNVIAVWQDEEIHGYFVVLNGNFNLGGVKGNDSNIVWLHWDGGRYNALPANWLAPGATFKGKIDAIEMSR